MKASELSGRDLGRIITVEWMDQTWNVPIQEIRHGGFRLDQVTLTLRLDDTNALYYEMPDDVEVTFVGQED